VKRNFDPQTGDPYVCADCIGFFYFREDEEFVPIAIQLEPKDPESIFLSKDAEYDWLLAKMYFRSTMQNIHEVLFLLEPVNFELRLAVLNFLRTFSLSCLICF